MLFHAFICENGTISIRYAPSAPIDEVMSNLGDKLKTAIMIALKAEESTHRQLVRPGESSYTVWLLDEKNRIGLYHILY